MSASRARRPSIQSSQASNANAAMTDSRVSTSRAGSSSTPHPNGVPSRLSISATPSISYTTNQPRSVTSSSNPLRRTPRASTASGRKSHTTSSLWGSNPSEIICAISEARGISPAVGLALVNITTGEAVLSQICDTQFYVKAIHKIQMYEPSTILMVNTAFPPNPKSNLLSIIEEELPDTTIEPLDRKYWSERAGLEFIQTLVFREDYEAINVAIEGNFYATCSFAAVMKYIQLSCRLTIAPHSLRIRYQPSENTMMIDISTIRSLELIQNLQNSKSKDCLFGLLNETLTPMGSRMLRSNILEPSCQTENILIPRYDALDELTMKEDMFFEIRKALKNFTDVEKLLTTLVIVPSESSIYVSEQAINDILSIKSFINAIPLVYEALGAARASLLTRIRQICRPELIQHVADLITSVINEDVIAMKTALDMRNQRTFAVKSGIRSMLDVARQTYKEANEDVNQHVEELNREHDISAQTKYDPRRKFWLRLDRSEFEDRELPGVLINCVRKGAWIECQTLALIQLNNRLTDSSNEAIMLSDKVIQELLDGIRAHVPHLFQVCEGIGLLDMIASFGQSATTRDYVRPELGDTLALKAARHPICERLNPERFVPNDVYASAQYRFQVITGCNMSGKSTHMRMISLLQVMAQIGCFVPAQYASFSIIQQLFVRMSTDDSIEANMSTFSLEMREMAFILRNVNEKSLTIIDELGRGTSTRDGLSIALAISEALVQSNSLVFFTTHFQQLGNILRSHPGVLSLHLATDVTESDMDIPTVTMLYKIESGPVEERHYGLDLARAIKFPRLFMERAERVSMALEEQTERKMEVSQSRALLRRRKLILNLHQMLLCLWDSDIDDDALGSYIKQLQQDFIVGMEEIERSVQLSESEPESELVEEDIDVIEVMDSPL